MCTVKNSFTKLFSGPVHTQQLSSPTSPQRIKFVSHVDQVLSSVAETQSIYSAASMLSLHSIMDGGGSRMDSEKGEVRGTSIY